MIEVIMINGEPYTECEFGLEPMSQVDYLEALQSYSVVHKEGNR